FRFTWCAWDRSSGCRCTTAARPVRRQPSRSRRWTASQRSFTRCWRRASTFRPRPTRPASSRSPTPRRTSSDWRRACARRSPPSVDIPAMKAPRVFQLTALALVLVSAVEVGWWLLDQHRFAVDKVREMHQVYDQQVIAAQALLDAGTPAARVRALLPQIIVTDGRRAELTPDVDRRLLEEERRHIAQYAW